jgi:hypothetical protein
MVASEVPERSATSRIPIRPPLILLVVCVPLAIARYRKL